MNHYVKIMNDDELYHYGVIGMKWGQRRLKRKIKKAGKQGKTDKVAKLKKRLAEEKEIEKLSPINKMFLSREGVKANIRMINKGRSFSQRMVELHGRTVVTSAVASAAGRKVTPTILTKLGAKGDLPAVLKVIGASTALSIATVGGARLARDASYRMIDDDQEVKV